MENEQAELLMSEVKKTLPWVTNEQLISALEIVRMLVTGCGNFSRQLLINLIVFVLMVKVDVNQT